MNSWKLLGEIIRDEHHIAPEVIESALRSSGKTGKRLGECLLAAKEISEAQLAEALAAQQGIPCLQILPTEVPAELLALVPIGFAKEYRIFPMGRADGRLQLAMADPLDTRPLNDLAALTGDWIEVRVAPASEIVRAINRSYERQSEKAREVVDEIEGKGDALLVQGLEPADLLDSCDEAPIIRFVNSLITQGYKERASDIHIEPFETEMIVRYRIDGILYEVLRPPQKAQASDHLAHQNHGRSQHRRETPAAGRSLSRADRRSRMSISASPPCRPPSASAWSCACLRKARAFSNSLKRSALNQQLLQQIDRMIQQTARDFPGHRTDRFGQDDHPVCRADPPQRPPKRTSSPSKIRSNTS